jgi:hypothetical protein
MAITPKIRPSVTLREVQLVIDAVDTRILSLIGGGNINTPVLLELSKLKTYFESLQPKDNEAERMLAAYLAASGTQVNQEALTLAMATKSPQVSDSIEATKTVSPIDMPELTDDQRYDLLALRTEKQRTPDENKWFLNVGTFIRMKRAGINTGVSEGDL